MEPVGHPSPVVGFLVFDPSRKQKNGPGVKPVMVFCNNLLRNSAVWHHRFGFVELSRGGKFHVRIQFQNSWLTSKLFFASLVAMKLFGLNNPG